MKMKKIRVVSALLALVTALPLSLSSCVKKYDEVKDVSFSPVSDVSENTEKTAYTGAKDIMANKSGMYYSFDDIAEGTEYTANQAIGKLNLVPKQTTFSIVKGTDGNCLRYFRNQSSSGTDPYMDVNVAGMIKTGEYVVSADFKMGPSYNLSGSVFQIIYRGTTNKFNTLVSVDTSGNLKSGKNNVGKLTPSSFTNVAVVVNAPMGTYTVYVDGIEKVTETFDNNFGDATFQQVRVVQTSGTYTGTMYIDNIAVYDGVFPLSILPDDNTPSSVKEDFSGSAVGVYAAGRVVGDNASATLMVAEGGDGNRFLKCQLKAASTELKMNKGKLTGGNYLGNFSFYRKDENCSLTVTAGETEICRIDKAGKVLLNGDTVYRTDTEQWFKVAAVVSGKGFELYVDGILCGKYEGEEEISDFDYFTVKIDGKVGDGVFFDDFGLYSAVLPYEYTGVSSLKGDSITLLDYTNYGIFSGDKLTLSDKYFDEDGNPLLKWSNISISSGRGFTFEKAGFTGNILDYNTFRLKFYCPEALDYTILLVFDCGNPTGSSWDYYTYYVTFDSKGWVTLDIPYSALGPSRNPEYSRMYKLMFINCGWGFIYSDSSKKINTSATLNTEASGCVDEREFEVYIDSVELLKK